MEAVISVDIDALLSQVDVNAVRVSVSTWTRCSTRRILTRSSRPILKHVFSSGSTSSADRQWSRQVAVARSVDRVLGRRAKQPSARSGRRSWSAVQAER